MKNWKYIFVLAALLIATVIFAPRLFKSKNKAVEVGEKAPECIVNQDDKQISLNDYAGKYLLVDMWSSANGASRLQANRYNQLNCARDVRINRLSLNFDRSEALFREVLARDHMNPMEQIHIGDGAAAEQVMREFGVRNGEYNSYLIDPSGRVVSINPEVDEVRSILPNQSRIAQN